jgi:hypothetical protein
VEYTTKHVRRVFWLSRMIVLKPLAGATSNSL